MKFLFLGLLQGFALINLFQTNNVFVMIIAGLVYIIAMGIGNSIYYNNGYNKGLIDAQQGSAAREGEVNGLK